MKMIVEVQRSENQANNTVLVGLDKEALDRLIGYLERLKSLAVGEHIHLMSDEWGMGDLSAQTRDEGNFPVHHLRIDLVA